MYKSQFDQVRREGRKTVAPGVVVVVAPCKESGCGVICSKKYSLLAVERNRARRLLWESYRKIKPMLPPCRIVLIPRQKLKSYKQEQAAAEVIQQLILQGILPGEPELQQAQSSCSSESTRN